MDNPTDAAVEAKDKELWNEWLPSSGTSFGRFVIRHFLTRQPGTEDVDRIGIPAHAPTRSALDSAFDPMLGNTPVRKAVVDMVLGLFENARRPLTEVDVERIAAEVWYRSACRGANVELWANLHEAKRLYIRLQVRDTLTIASWPIATTTDSAASDRLAWLEKTHIETMDQNLQLIIERDALNARVAELEAGLATAKASECQDCPWIEKPPVDTTAEDATTGCADDALPGTADQWRAGLGVFTDSRKISVDLNGMRNAANQDEDWGNNLQADYLRRGANEIDRLRAELAAMKEGAINPFCDRCKTPSMCEMEDCRFGLVNIVSPTQPPGTIRLGEGLTEAQGRVIRAAEEWGTRQGGVTRYYDYRDDLLQSVLALRASAAPKPEAVDWVKIAKDRSHTSEERYSSAEVIAGLCEQITALRAGGV